MSFRNSLTRHLTPVGNAHIRSELAGGGALVAPPAAVVVDGVPTDKHATTLPIALVVV